MKHVGTIAIAALILLLTGGPPASAQEPRERPSPEVDCDSICLAFPDQAPAECTCAITGVAGGGVGPGGVVEVADPAAAAVIDEMQASYREALAGIHDYTVIQASWANGVLLGPPAPVYYEVANLEGGPMPRQVPQGELARRQAQASGQPAPEQTAAGISTMLRMLGEGVPEGYAPADEGEALFINVFNAVAATGIAQEAADELDKSMSDVNSEEASDDELLDRLMRMEELGARLRLTLSQPCEVFTRDEILESVGLVGLQCLVLTANADDLAGLDLGPGWADYELIEAEVIVGGSVSSLPAASTDVLDCTEDCSQLEDLVRKHVDVLPLPFSTSFRLKHASQGFVKIQHSSTAAEVADSRTRFIPRRTKSKIIGIRGVQEVTGEVLRVIANEGPLSHERLAREVHEAMREVTNN